MPANLKVVLGASTLANLSHSYDANGNVTFIDDAVNGSSFDRSMGYDDLDRLETASGFWGAGAYSFDALGNIRTKTESGIDLDYTYSAGANRLASIDDSVGSADYSFSYDSYGNVTNNGSQGFAYNLAGQMTSSTSPSVSYKYDGQNRRVQKTEGGQTGYTVYGANGRLMHKLKGGVSTHYLYAGSLLIAEKQGSNLHYIHTDLLGSPIKGDNGTSYSEHYRPWGEKKDHPTQLAEDVGYTGHQSDVATGLTYMQARYYDPVVGRFMTVDPVGFRTDAVGSFNRYSYVLNGPYRYTDPAGEAEVLIWNKGPTPSGSSPYGHVAIRTDDGTYVSKFPSKRGRVVSAANFHDQRDDETEYGRPADEVIDIALPDEEAAAAAANDILGELDATWSIFDNCADTVEEILNAGDLETDHNDPINTPQDLKEEIDDYAEDR